MDSDEILERSPVLRRVLRTWSVLCALAVAGGVVATVGLIVSSATSDAFIDLSGPFALAVFGLAVVIVAVWACVRGAILLCWRISCWRRRPG